jgi:hypothetical protein
MKQEVIQAIPYILAFLALLYLALPHIVECYVSYSRPWNTHEEMTNADIDAKHEFHADKENTVWEMFTETEVKTDKQLPSILPGETVKAAGSKTILPGVPTPKKSDTPDVPAGPTEPSNKKELEPAIDKTAYLKPEEETPKEEKANKRAMDTEVQKPKMKSTPPPKITKLMHPTPTPSSAPIPARMPDIKQSGQEIWGPRAPKLDPNQPRPSDSGNGKHGSGVYPHIYGPESLEAPGSKDNGGDSSDPPPFDFVPAAEFPAGPLQPSPYLNDFSKMLKT